MTTQQSNSHTPAYCCAKQRCLAHDAAVAWQARRRLVDLCSRVKAPEHCARCSTDSVQPGVPAQRHVRACRTSVSTSRRGQRAVHRPSHRTRDVDVAQCVKQSQWASGAGSVQCTKSAHNQQRERRTAKGGSAKVVSQCKATRSGALTKSQRK